MGSVIWIKDGKRDKRWDERAEDWSQALAAQTDPQLVGSLNRQVGNNGWVSARATYLRALSDELLARGFDFSAVDGLARFPGERTLALRGKELVYVATPAGSRRNSSEIQPQ